MMSTLYCCCSPLFISASRKAQYRCRTALENTRPLSKWRNPLRTACCSREDRSSPDISLGSITLLVSGSWLDKSASLAIRTVVSSGLARLIEDPSDLTARVWICDELWWLRELSWSSAHSLTIDTQSIFRKLCPSQCEFWWLEELPSSSGHFLKIDTRSIFRKLLGC